MTKPGLPQGTRDFGPEIVHKRQFIFNCIRSVFELYGYEPLETPAMENLETLMGKYGDEGDKLIFKILNNGMEHESKKAEARAAFEHILEGKNDKEITQRALRYDLTIPFARFVAMHHHELPMPFRRYQIQPVWRADRPQKGRYREFYQCDADIVGSRSLLNEVELARIYLTVFEKLGIPVELRINHRKILGGLAEACGGTELTTTITTAIDKLDKIGMDKVLDELREKNLSGEAINLIAGYLQLEGDSTGKISQLEKLLTNETARKGIEDLRQVLKYFGPSSTRVSNSASSTYANSASSSQGSNPISSSSLVLDFSLARGLNYYTGIIFEVRALGVKMGSIGGGGRYDDLTGLFGVPGIPGVGISFGVDRIYDVMEELKLFPATVQHTVELLFFNLGGAAAEKSFELVQQLRDKGVPTELYHEQAKMDKQFKYAEKKRIPRVVIVGADELSSGKAKVKDLDSGVQSEVAFEDLSNLEFRRK